MFNMRFVLPDSVIDLFCVHEVHQGVSQDAIEVGAMTSQHDLEFSTLIETKCLLMHQAFKHVLIVRPATSARSKDRCAISIPLPDW